MGTAATYNTKRLLLHVSTTQTFPTRAVAIVDITVVTDRTATRGDI
jgi:hypothetical protein